jgi:hypothetical protein
MKSALLLWSLLLAVLLGGCATSRSVVSGGARVAELQRVFVLTNANDNRALDRQIVNALRAHGLTADSGPRTMMPEDTQAFMTYDDHWSWDFGDRLQVLRLVVREVRKGDTLAIVEFSAKIPGRRSPASIVDELITKLFATKAG